MTRVVSDKKIIWDDGLKTAFTFTEIPKNNKDIRGFNQARNPVERLFGIEKNAFKFFQTAQYVNIGDEASENKHNRFILAGFFFQDLNFAENCEINAKIGLPIPTSRTEMPSERTI